MPESCSRRTKVVQMHLTSWCCSCILGVVTSWRISGVCSSNRYVVSFVPFYVRMFVNDPTVSVAITVSYSRNVPAGPYLYYCCKTYPGGFYERYSSRKLFLIARHFGFCRNLLTLASPYTQRLPPRPYSNRLSESRSQCLKLFLNTDFHDAQKG